MLSAKFWLPGLLLSTGLCSVILGPVLPLGMPLYEPLIAVSCSCYVCAVAVVSMLCLISLLACGQRADNMHELVLLFCLLGCLCCVL
jgi:hypothetical protein